MRVQLREVEGRNWQTSMTFYRLRFVIVQYRNYTISLQEESGGTSGPQPANSDCSTDTEPFDPEEEAGQSKTGLGRT